MFKGVVIRVKDFSQKADKYIKGFVGGFKAIASHVKKMLLKRRQTLLPAKATGFFVLGREFIPMPRKEGNQDMR